MQSSINTSPDGLSSTAASAGSEDAAGRRVCDQCRLRKIRCDKDWPCSNCRTAKRSCTTTGAGQRPKETRQRVLISSQYERKIDRIENRLGNIEGLLKKISNNGPQAYPDYAAALLQAGTPSTLTQTTPSGDIDSSEDDGDYEEDSGIAAHTAFASDFLQSAVKRTTLREVNPKMEAALASLSQLVDIQKRRTLTHGPRFPLQLPLPPGGLCKLPMPPVGVVVPLLKKMQSSPPTLFTFLCSLVGVWDFTSICRQVYFATEDYSDATFIIVNSLLYNLFVEQQLTSVDAATRDEDLPYILMCRANLETGLANLPLFLSPKFDVMQALLLGALYAIDMSRPSVAWSLVTSASQLCLTSGLHRIRSQFSDTPEMTRAKRTVFWQVYMLDKCLSLRLGRSSTIQDYDIEIPRVYDLRLFDSFSPSSSDQFLDLWIQMSGLQGRLHEQLYSAAALAQPQAELTRRARALADECSLVSREAELRREEVISHLNELNSPKDLEIFLRGDEIQFQVLLTMAYRAIRPTEGSVSRFCDECLQAARKAMNIHLQSRELLEEVTKFKSIYYHWNLLLLPYAPFFVLFCYVIETSSQEDLHILDQFIMSLEAAREESETVDNLYRLCKVMYNALVLYVEARSHQQEDRDMIPIGEEFEMYLSQLGFMPPEMNTMAQAATIGDNGLAMQNPSLKMADWFVGDRNMIGLLEEDLSQMDGFQWMQPGNVPM